MKTLLCGRFRLSFTRPLVMGIVNLTPDSFSGDGTLHAADAAKNADAAIARAREHIENGADILDLGAESTRPGADPVPAEEELARLLPVLEKLSSWDVPLSVDTMKPEVMQAALAAGADMVNDINGFRAPGALEAVAASNCALCVMHMQGEPRTMQEAPQYADVVAEVCDFLAERIDECRSCGIAAGRLILDPGFGFGKSLEHNIALFRGLPELAVDNLPLLVGACRKKMLGEITGRPVAERGPAGIAAAIAAAQQGASIIRVHDVKEVADALKVWRMFSPGH